MSNAVFQKGFFVFRTAIFGALLAYGIATILTLTATIEDQLQRRWMDKVGLIFIFSILLVFCLHAFNTYANKYPEKKIVQLVRLTLWASVWVIAMCGVLIALFAFLAFLMNNGKI